MQFNLPICGLPISQFALLLLIVLWLQREIVCDIEGKVIHTIEKMGEQLRGVAWHNNHLYVAVNPRIEVYDDKLNMIRHFGDSILLGPQEIAIMTIDNSFQIFVIDSALHNISVFDSCGNLLRQYGEYGDG